MLSNHLIEYLNHQTNLEFYSANLYLQMSAWAAFKGLDGCAGFLRGHADEEMGHMQRLFIYVNEAGALAKLGAIEAPLTDFDSIAQVFETIYQHECDITGQINQLVDAAFTEKDYSTIGKSGNWLNRNHPNKPQRTNHHRQPDRNCLQFCSQPVSRCTSYPRGSYVHPKKTLLASAIFLTLGSLSPFSTAVADEQELRQEILNLKHKVERLEKSRIPLVTEETEKKEPQAQWFDSITLSGLVEVEAGYADTPDGSESNIILATMEFSIDAQLTDWVNAHVLFLYEDGMDNPEYALGASWINNLADCDNLQETIIDPDALQKKVGGIGLNGGLDLGSIVFIAEYLGATQTFDTADLAFDGSGAKPQAWNLEASWLFRIMEKKAVIGVAWQQTKDALALELPESRFLATVSLEVYKNIALSLEYAHDQDYSVNKGGSGDDSDALTLPLTTLL